MVYCLLYINSSTDNFNDIDNFIENNYYNILVIEVKNINQSRTVKLTRSHFKNDQTTQNVLNVMNITNSESVAQIHRIDDHLKKLSKFKKIRNNSKLIYPNEVLDMTNMIINKESCSKQFGKDLLLLVLVFNRVDGFERRQTIRKTWGRDIKAEPRSKLYFTVGLSKNETVQKELEKEDNKYGDIIQFGFYESYYNCTIKALGLLRWTSMSCPFVKHMLKVDDDSLILTDNMINFCNSTNDDSIYGHLWQNSLVGRGRDKWALNVDDYPEKIYPNYIGGPYLIPGSIIIALYETAITKSLPAVPFEDVYLTGIVASKLEIPRKMLYSLLYLESQGNIYQFHFDSFYNNITIFWQGLNDYLILKVWYDMKKYWDR